MFDQKTDRELDKENNRSESNKRIYRDVYCLKSQENNYHDKKIYEPTLIKSESRKSKLNINHLYDFRNQLESLNSYDQSNLDDEIKIELKKIAICIMEILKN